MLVFCQSVIVWDPEPNVGCCLIKMRWLRFCPDNGNVDPDHQGWWLLQQSVSDRAGREGGHWLLDCGSDQFRVLDTTLQLVNIASTTTTKSCDICRKLQIVSVENTLPSTIQPLNYIRSKMVLWVVGNLSCQIVDEQFWPCSQLMGPSLSFLAVIKTEAKGSSNTSPLCFCIAMDTCATFRLSKEWHTSNQYDNSLINPASFGLMILIKVFTIL